MEKWLGFHFSTGSYPGEDYIKFQKDARKYLKKMLDKKGVNLYAFHKNHYEFCAIAEMNGGFVYISIPDVRFSQDGWYKHVLYRTMAHEKDWTGGSNRYCVWNDIGEKVIELLMS